MSLFAANASFWITNRVVTLSLSLPRPPLRKRSPGRRPNATLFASREKKKYKNYDVLFGPLLLRRYENNNLFPLGWFSPWTISHHLFFFRVNSNGFILCSTASIRFSRVDRWIRFPLKVHSISDPISSPSFSLWHWVYLVFIQVTRFSPMSLIKRKEKENTYPPPPSSLAIDPIFDQSEIALERPLSPEFHPRQPPPRCVLGRRRLESVSRLPFSIISFVYCCCCCCCCCWPLPVSEL